MVYHRQIFHAKSTMKLKEQLVKLAVIMKDILSSVPDLMCT